MLVNPHGSQPFHWCYSQEAMQNPSKILSLTSLQRFLATAIMLKVNYPFNLMKYYSLPTPFHFILMWLLIILIDSVCFAQRLFLVWTFHLVKLLMILKQVGIAPYECFCLNFKPLSYRTHSKCHWFDHLLSWLREDSMISKAPRHSSASHDADERWEDADWNRQAMLPCSDHGGISSLYALF